MWLQKSSSVLLRFMCGIQDGVAPGPSAAPSGEQPSRGPPHSIQPASSGQSQATNPLCDMWVRPWRSPGGAAILRKPVHLSLTIWTQPQTPAHTAGEGDRMYQTDRSQPRSPVLTTLLLTPLQAGPSCPLGRAHRAQAHTASRPAPGTRRCVLCALEPALLQAQPGGAERHLAVDQLLPLSA